MLRAARPSLMQKSALQYGQGAGGGTGLTKQRQKLVGLVKNTLFEVMDYSWYSAV